MYTFNDEIFKYFYHPLLAQQSMCTRVLTQISYPSSVNVGSVLVNTCFTECVSAIKQTGCVVNIIKLFIRPTKKNLMHDF